MKLRPRDGPVTVSRMQARVGVLLLLAIAPLALAADDRVIQVHGDAVTVRLSKVPVREVIDDIARQANAEVRGNLQSSQDVTATFDDVPLPEALHRLLGDQNFALVYAPDGALRRVKLLGGAPGAPGPAVVTAPPTTTALPPPVDLATLIAKHQPVPIHGPLADALGTRTATLPQLLEAALHHDDPTVRTEAVRSALATLEFDPALRASVIGQLNAMDDATATSFLRQAAGDHAEEFAMQVLAQARANEIRLKASSVLQKLRAGS